MKENSFNDVDQSILDTASIEGKDLNNSKVFQNPDWELLESLTDRQLKDLRGDLEGDYVELQQEMEFVEYMENEYKKYKTRTRDEVQFDIMYTQYKIDTVNSVYKQRVEARGEVYTDLYFCY